MAEAIVRIATRTSRLALWQAEYVRGQLRSLYPDRTFTVLPLRTRGDDIVDRPLAEVGGKGLFIKALEDALAQGEAEIAVHSMKDVPAQLPAGFALAAMLAPDDPHDALVSNHWPDLDALPQGARIGTSSLRRQSQIRHRRPDLQVEFLRGNVGTRLQRLDEGLFDAIILAAAGLRRLGLGERITYRLAPEICLPAVGQGVLGIECRENDEASRALVDALNDPQTAIRVTAERAMNARLGGSCNTPIAGYAQVQGDRLRLRGLVGSPDGRRIVEDEVAGFTEDAVALGRSLGERLLHHGADAILRELGARPS